MAKVLVGKVVSTKMNNTVVVEIVRKTPHPVYKKRVRKSKNFHVDSAGLEVKVGDNVKIVETKPISKNKHFKLMEVEK
ncbi:MAG TPA: 30S ribosomal protein S17 [Patescibacteria group bacterium]|nr:30S ribosomal protein S17 [Patescibacteria group bacterium]